VRVAVERALRGALALSLLATVPACGPGAGGYDDLMAEGRSRLERGEARRALDAFLRAQRLRPQRREPYVQVASLCERLGLPEVGIPVLEAAVERDDEHRVAYRFMLAVLQEGADRRREAEAGYRACIDLDPEFAPARANLGQLLFTSGQNGEAIEVMEEAVRRFPRDLVVRLQYAEMLLRDGDVDGAERAMAEVLASDDPPRQSHYLMGLIDLRRDRSGAAREQLERAVAADPNDSRAWYQLARACGLLGDRGCESRALARFETIFRGSLPAGPAR
jgi:predicted Zn-dependent protease